MVELNFGYVTGRKIGGKQYHGGQAFSTKKEAQECAEFYRKRGRLARVVPEGYHYKVLWRKKKNE